MLTVPTVNVLSSLSNDSHSQEQEKLHYFVYSLKNVWQKAWAQSYNSDIWFNLAVWSKQLDSTILVHVLSNSGYSTCLDYSADHQLQQQRSHAKCQCSSQVLLGWNFCLLPQSASQVLYKIIY